MCRGYEHYSKLSMMTKVLCNVHANPSSHVSWQAADEWVYQGNITLSEKVCHIFTLIFCEILVLYWTLNSVILLQVKVQYSV